jgi:hypothetical protein
MVKQDNYNSHTMSPGTDFTMLQTNKDFGPPRFIIVHARKENRFVLNAKFIFLCEKVLTMYMTNCMVGIIQPVLWKIFFEDSIIICSC